MLRRVRWCRSVGSRLSLSVKLCTQIIGDCLYDGKKLRNTRLKHGDDAACKCDEGEDDRGVDGT